MRIQSESRVHHPLEDVYLAYRDRLPEIAAYIPDVREIRVLEREPLPRGLRLLNLWVADKEPPKVAQGIVRPEWLQWEDHARWDDDAHHVDWKIALPALPDRVRCGGRNAFFADGPAATRVVLTGDLSIDAARLPGVPRLLAGKIGPIAERFIVDLITPNLSRVNACLERFLDDQRALREETG